MTVTFTMTARCAGCPWTATGPGADKAAEKHTREHGHPTVTASLPGGKQ